MNVLNSNLAPDAVGPYSQGIKSKEVVFLSGQIGLSKQSGRLVDGIEEQTCQAFENIQHVLAADGLSLKHVVKVTLLLADMNDFTKVNEIYGHYFQKPYPARSTYAVAALPLGGLIEIEAVAEVGD